MWSHLEIGSFQRQIKIRSLGWVTIQHNLCTNIKGLPWWLKNPPAMWETWVWFLGWEDPMEKGMASHPSILAWRIPWTEEPGRLQPMGSQRVRYDWVTNTTMTTTNIKRKFGWRHRHTQRTPCEHEDRDLDASTSWGMPEMANKPAEAGTEGNN